jgi:hypothetical protein
MEKEPDIRKMLIPIKVIDAAAVETAGAADEAVDLVALGEKELGQIRSILAGYAGDKGFRQR